MRAVEKTRKSERRGRKIDRETPILSELDPVSSVVLKGFALAVAAILLAATSCSRGQPAPSSTPNNASGAAAEVIEAAPAPADPAPIDSRFEARLREIAGEYTGYDMMVGSLRWAPGMCMAPPMTMSKAPPETPHAKKLYHLLVKDPDAYADAAQQSQPVGQVIVKQSFKAEEVKNSTDENRADAVRGRDGKLYMPGEAADLFVMFKVDSGRSGTDDGWVYGTLAPGEERATSAGRVASCMECHQNAKPDRVFGVKGLKSSGE